jgi:hypothetical protein
MMLESLGHSADEVADKLRSLGIQGAPNTVRQLNPVVRYLHTLLGDEPSVRLIEKTVTIVHADGRQQIESLPPAACDFLERFNEGRYPDLLLPA